MTNVPINFQTNADIVGRKISTMEKALEEVSKEFRNAQIGSEDFFESARAVDELTRNISQAKSAVKAFGEEYTRTAQIAASNTRGSWAKAFRQMEEISSDLLIKSKADALNLRTSWGKALAEMQEISQKMREGTGGAPTIAASTALFPPGSLIQLERRLAGIRDQARKIAPDTSKWHELNNEARRLERRIDRINKKGAAGPSLKSRAGAAGGAFLYGGGIGGAGSALGGVVGGLAGGPAGAFAGAAVGQIADSLGQGMARLADQAAGLQRLRRGLAMASIDAQDFAEAEEQVRKSSEKLLLPLDQTYKYFSQLRVNTKQYNLSIAETGRIMEGVALAVSSTGGSMEDIDGAMRAVVQIFSKGSVQAEELRGQLGERFPGAVVKFAKANNMSFAQLQDALKKGEIGIKEFVKFAEENYEDYAEFSEQLATAPEYAGRRLGLAFQDMQRSIGEALGPAGAIIQDFLTDSIKGINDFLEENKDFLTEYVTIWAQAFARVGRVLGDFLKVLFKVGVEIAKFFKNLTFGIRNMFSLVGVAELKGQIEKLDAQILATSDRRSKRALARQRASLQAQFEAKGGEAALAKAETNFVFGGAGAGMDLETAAGGEGGGKRQTAKDALAAAKREMNAAFRDLESGFATEAQRRLVMELEEIQLQIVAAQRAGNEEEVFKLKQYAKLMPLLLKEGALLEQIKKRQELINAQTLDEQYLQQHRLRQEEDKRRLFEVQSKIRIEGARQALAVEQRLFGLTKEKYAEMGLNLERIIKQSKEIFGGPTVAGGVGFVEGAGIGAQAAALAAAEERTTRLKEGVQGLSESINQSLGNALVDVALKFEDLNGTAADLVSSLAGYFRQLSSTIIQEMTRAFVNKAVFGLLGGISGGASSNTALGSMGPGNFNLNGFGDLSPLPLTGFANGGIVKGPTMGLVGEGRFNEAVVPLPNGKSIPVDLGGGTGGDIATSIVVNVNNGQASSSMKGNQGNQLAKNIEGAVKEVIMRETRPGGIIYSSRQ